jgi:hypothetical protein
MTADNIKAPAMMPAPINGGEDLRQRSSETLVDVCVMICPQCGAHHADANNERDRNCRVPPCDKYAPTLSSAPNFKFWRWNSFHALRVCPIEPSAAASRLTIHIRRRAGRACCVSGPMNVRLPKMLAIRRRPTAALT